MVTIKEIMWEGRDRQTTNPNLGVELIDKDIPEEFGGGHIDVFHLFTKSTDITVKINMVYLKDGICADSSRVIGVDSGHSNHAYPGNVNHLHQCERSSPLDPNANYAALKSIFFNKVGEFLVRNFIKHQGLTEEQEVFADQVDDVLSGISKSLDRIINHAESNRQFWINLRSKTNLTLSDFGGNQTWYDLWLQYKDLDQATDAYHRLLGIDLDSLDLNNINSDDFR